MIAEDRGINSVGSVSLCSPPPLSWPAFVGHDDAVAPRTRTRVRRGSNATAYRYCPLRPPRLRMP